MRSLTIFDHAAAERPDRVARARMREQHDLLTEAAKLHDDHPFARFVLMFLHGLERDLLALVHKSYTESWRHARVPTLFRGFMTLEFGEDDREEAILQIAKGRYLKGFAMLILAGIYREAGRRADFESMVKQLRKAYPHNAVLPRIKP